MRKTFLSAFLILSAILPAQDLKSELTAVQNITQAREFVSTHHNAELTTLNAGKDSSAVMRQLMNRDFTEDSTFYYKRVDSSSELSFRARYVFLDGKKISMKQIDSLRKIIVAKYKSGTSFTELVAAYNMDGNRNQGDLGWFTEGVMEEKFESAVRSHKKNDLFLLDIKYNKWCYVVLKTHDNTEIKSLVVIKARK